MRRQWMMVMALLIVAGCAPRRELVAPPAAELQPANVRLQGAVKPADAWLQAAYKPATWMLDVDLSAVGLPLPSLSDRYSYMVYAFDGRNTLVPSDWGLLPGGSSDTTDHYLIAVDGVSWEAAMRAARGAGDLPSAAAPAEGMGFQYLGTQPSAHVRYALFGERPPAGPISLVFVYIGPAPDRQVLWTTTVHVTLPG